MTCDDWKPSRIIMASQLVRLIQILRKIHQAEIRGKLLFEKKTNKNRLMWRLVRRITGVLLLVSFLKPNWSIYREETDHDDCSGRIMESDDWNLI